MERHLSLSLCYLRHNGSMEKAACFMVRFLLLSFRGTTYFPAHLGVNIPAPHFIPHQQLCTNFKKDQVKAKRLASAFVLISYTYQNEE